MRLQRAGQGELTASRRGPALWWLLLPFALAVAAAAAWSGWWLLARARITDGVDQAAAAHRAQGRTLVWERRTVSGFPFRHKIAFEGLRFASPSGWAIEAPRLEAQANAYRLTHWVASAPRGLRLVRPQAGAVDIGARVLRASLSGADSSPPRVAVEGVGLTFASVAGAEPFFFTAAERLEIHLRPLPDRPQDAALVVRLRQATPRPAGLVAFVSAGRPADLVWESVLTRFGSLRGEDWAAAVGRWSEAGGRMQVTQASLKAGDLTAGARNGVLYAGGDGRLRGRLSLQLNRPLQALGALGQSRGADAGAIGAAAAVAQARGAKAELPLVFEAGMMTVGPVSLGEAPRVY